MNNFQIKVLRRLKFEINRWLKIDVVRAYSSANLKSHLREVLRDYRINTVIDVGANEGQFGSEIRSLGFQGELHSFEPVKNSYDKLLKTSAGDKNWFAYKFALGDKPGRATINVFSASVFSSILPASRQGAESFSELKSSQGEDIEVTTLDDFFSRKSFGNDKRILLKMDTQGYDLKVFGGAKESRGKISCMMSELSLIQIYDGMPTYLEALSAYSAGGFSVSGFYPISRNADLSSIEMDCILVQRGCFDGPNT